MPWLDYTDGEVNDFHPVFHEGALDALRVMGRDSDLAWKHHNRTPGNRLVPDFVLLEKKSGRWLLTIEIKRSRSSIFRTNNQVQAKTYAEHNARDYRAGSPKYFAISNLEETLLFALKNGSPPKECLLKDGHYFVGRFEEIDEATFRNTLSKRIIEICERVLAPERPEFDEVWPRILSDLVQYADRLIDPATLQEPSTPNWQTVRGYFCHEYQKDASRIFLLRCLFAEFINGILTRYHHPDASRLIPILAAPATTIGSLVATSFARIREIEFDTIFEDVFLDDYRRLSPKVNRDALAEYIRAIVNKPAAIRDLAMSRLDTEQLLDGLLHATHPGEELDNKGKVTTDPELASLLAHLTISRPTDRVIDPCSGDGALLEAAYDRLEHFGLDHNTILSRISGIEADPILHRLAFLRLMLREPRLIDTVSAIDLVYGDMFSNPTKIEEADVVLMNPPFKRYEAQDNNPVPDSLRSHYVTAIERLSHKDSIAVGGQPNLFYYYLEFVIRAAKDGCIFGIILDNKWYHNRYGERLRNFLLSECEIDSIIEYPYSNLFSAWAIATSVLICRKKRNKRQGQNVKFIRCRLDLAQIDPREVSQEYPDVDSLLGWTQEQIEQSSLDAKIGWKNYFGKSFDFDFRVGLPPLASLYSGMRRGSLAKEEGGVSILGFPFSCKSFGSVRAEPDHRRGPYQADIVRRLSKEENAELARLASKVPEQFRGFALKNPDRISSFVLSDDDLQKDSTFEPPCLRGLPVYWSDTKIEWSDIHDKALREIHRDKAVKDFIERFRALSGLSAYVMPDKYLWVGLREPYAGELIIPRKTRVGYKILVNSHACERSARQVRLSSNFISLSGCTAIDEESELDAETATKLIAAFLLSSFGQVQMEMEGYNREGCLSLEKFHLESIHVVDPRTIKPETRKNIISSLEDLPFPVDISKISSESTERTKLDLLFAEVICEEHPSWEVEELLAEVYAILDEYVVGRRQ
jgi:BpuSI N-terminal domain/N-6 DNA Methylase